MIAEDLRQALATFAAQPAVLVASDFDGVLAPLVDDPTDSRPIAGSVPLLQQLALVPRTHAALVSGRDLASLRAVSGVEQTSAVTLIGSHGAQSSVPLDLSTDLDAAAQARLERCRSLLSGIIARHVPARLEHKPVGAVLHTRGIDPGVAAAATAEALLVPEQVRGAFVMQGKDVVEISVVDVTKGMALHALADRVGTTATLYLGDDVTDEKAFAVLPAAAGHLSIKVGDGPTAAAHRVPGPAAVLEVLRAVAQARSR